MKRYRTPAVIIMFVFLVLCVASLSRLNVDAAGSSPSYLYKNLNGGYSLTYPADIIYSGKKINKNELEKKLSISKNGITIPIKKVSVKKGKDVSTGIIITRITLNDGKKTRVDTGRLVIPINPYTVTASTPVRKIKIKKENLKSITLTLSSNKSIKVKNGKGLRAVKQGDGTFKVSFNGNLTGNVILSKDGKLVEESKPKDREPEDEDPSEQPSDDPADDPSKNGDEEPWKKAYRSVLNDIRAGGLIPDLEGAKLEHGVFILKDLNNDSIPELLVGIYKNSDVYSEWELYTAKANKAEDGISIVNYYIPDTGELVTTDNMYMLGLMCCVHHFDGEKLTDGFIVMDDTPDIDGVDKETVFNIHYDDGRIESISKEEAESICEQYNHPELYPMGHSYDITRENIERFLGTRKSNPPGTAGALLDSFIDGTVSANDNGTPIMLSDLQSYDMGEEWMNYYPETRADVDNDGEDELIMTGPYGGMCLDALNGEINVIAMGNGTTWVLSYVKFDNAAWIVYSDLTHTGRQYRSFYKYDGTQNRSIKEYEENVTVADSFELNADYWDSPSGWYDENSTFTYRNRPITMQEYEALLAEMKNLIPNM